MFYQYKKASVTPLNNEAYKYMCVYVYTNYIQIVNMYTNLQIMFTGGKPLNRQYCTPLKWKKKTGEKELLVNNKA